MTVLLAVDLSSVSDALTTLITGLESTHEPLAKAGDEVMRKLGLLEVALALLWCMFQGESIKTLLQKALALSIWMTIIVNFHELAKGAAKWLVTNAAAVSGSGDPWELVLNPGAIMQMGTAASEPLMLKVADVSLFDSGDTLMVAICALLLVFAYILLAVHVALTVVEFYLYLNIGALLIPFAALSQTRFIADKAINAVLHASIKLAVLAYITAAIKPIIAAIELHKSFGDRTELTWNDIFSMLLVATLCLFLSVFAPRMAAGLLHGSPSLSGTGLVLGAVAGATMVATPLLQGALKLGSQAFNALGSGLEAFGKQIPPVQPPAPPPKQDSGSGAGAAPAVAAAPPPPPAVTFVFFSDQARLSPPDKPALAGGDDKRPALGRGPIPLLPSGDKS